MFHELFLLVVLLRDDACTTCREIRALAHLWIFKRIYENKYSKLTNEQLYDRVFELPLCFTNYPSWYWQWLCFCSKLFLAHCYLFLILWHGLSITVRNFWVWRCKNILFDFSTWLLLHAVRALDGVPRVCAVAVARIYVANTGVHVRLVFEVSTV